MRYETWRKYINIHHSGLNDVNEDNFIVTVKVVKVAENNINFIRLKSKQ